MMTKKFKEPGERPYQRSFAGRKKFAFATTALACFCLLCVMGSFLVTNFETKTSLDVSSSGEMTDDYFREIIERELSDEILGKHLIVASQSSALVENADIESGNLENIRSAISFRTMERRDGRQYRLTAVFRGCGSEDEKHLVQNVARSLARRITETDNIAESTVAVQKQFEAIQANIESNASQLNSELESAYQLVNELNVGLSDVHESVEMLGTDDRIDSQFNRNNNLAAGKFDRTNISQLISAIRQKLDEFVEAENEREVYELANSFARIQSQLEDLGLANSEETGKSMRIINAAMPETNTTVRSILELLANCDTDSIQTRIGKAQNNLRHDSIQMREDVTSMKLFADKLSESRYVVNSISTATTAPSESSIGPGYILMLGLIAALFGSVISTHYRPELENIGFESSDSAEKLLGIPVIANIVEMDQEDTKEPVIANSIVRFSEVGLFGFALLTALLCLVQPELREAFVESPIYGLSRLSGMFFS